MKDNMQEVRFFYSHPPLGLKMICVVFLILLSGLCAVKADSDFCRLAVPMAGTNISSANSSNWNSNTRKSSYKVSSAYSYKPMRKDVGASNYSKNSGSYISKAGKVLYQTSAAELHSTNGSAMSYSSGSYSHGSSKSQSQNSYASVSLPSVSSTVLSWQSKINTEDALINGPRKVIRPDITKTEGGNTYYYEDETEEWIIAQNLEGDITKPGDYPGQISSDGNYSWDGSQWVYNDSAEVNEPIGNLPIWVLFLVMMVYVAIRYRMRKTHSK